MSDTWEKTTGKMESVKAVRVGEMVVGAINYTYKVCFFFFTGEFVAKIYFFLVWGVWVTYRGWVSDTWDKTTGKMESVKAVCVGDMVVGD